MRRISSKKNSSEWNECEQLKSRRRGGKKCFASSQSKLPRDSFKSIMKMPSQSIREKSHFKRRLCTRTTRGGKTFIDFLQRENPKKNRRRGRRRNFPRNVISIFAIKLFFRFSATGSALEIECKEENRRARGDGKAHASVLLKEQTRRINARSC